MSHSPYRKPHVPAPSAPGHTVRDITKEPFHSMTRIDHCPGPLPPGARIEGGGIVIGGSVLCGAAWNGAEGMERAWEHWEWVSGLTREWYEKAVRALGDDQMEGADDE